MRDIFGQDIEVGDHVVHVVSFHNGYLAKAVVIEGNDSFIKIKYTGETSEKLSWQKEKYSNKVSRLTTSEQRVICIKSINDIGEDFMSDEIKSLNAEIKKIKKRLDQAVDRENKLLEDNEALKHEVGKIHKRWSILDL